MPSFSAVFIFEMMMMIISRMILLHVHALLLRQIQIQEEGRNPQSLEFETYERDMSEEKDLGSCKSKVIKTRKE